MNDSANQKPSWWQRLASGLKRTSASIGDAIADIVTKRKLDAGTIEEAQSQYCVPTSLNLTLSKNNLLSPFPPPKNTSASPFHPTRAFRTPKE